MDYVAYDIFERRVLLKGQIKLLSGLHIGAGREVGPAGSDLPVIKDFSGMPFIPGASFKGVMRSTAEAFLRALPPKEGKRLHCNVLQDVERCIGSNTKKKIVNQEAEFKNCEPDRELWEHSCWVCRLFGSPWIASRVQVLDMPVDKSSFRREWLTVRDGVVIDRETGTAFAKGKFDFEVVPAHTCFNLEILVENPQDFQMGLLAVGIDFFNRGLSLLGGQTSRGLGRIQVVIDQIEEYTAESILNGLLVSGEEKKENREESFSSNSEDDASENDINDPAAVVCRCLAGGTDKGSSELVAEMQSKGWNKERLQSVGYYNYRELFKKMAKDGRIVEIDRDRYQSIDSKTVQSENTSQKTDDPACKNDIEKKLRHWTRALREKLGETVKSSKEGT